MPEKDVLIVDDEADVRDVLTGILQHNGYEVDQAGTVAEANHLLAVHRYRVVLVEWRMPDGDGAVIANLATEIGSLCDERSPTKNAAGQRRSTSDHYETDQAR